MAEKKRVLVIGCGYAGRSTAMLLDNDFDVVVVDPRDKLVHKILLRAAVRPEWVDCMLVPNDHILKNGRVVVASVVSTDFAHKRVTLSNGETVQFDFCVVASGAHSKAPVEPPMGAAPHEFFNKTAARIGKAKNIVVLGGGPVAIELAGEIKHKHPTATVTLVSNAASLCHNMKFPAETSAKIVDTLASVGVQTVLNKNVELGAHANESLISHHSALPDADLIINCTGSVPNTAFLPKDLLDQRGLVKVNEFLQTSAGGSSVFAIGDCNNVNEPKNFVNVCGKDYMQGMPVGHPDVVAANINALAATQPLTAYSPNSYVAGIIPVGPTASVTLGFPDAFGQYKAASYFYEAQFAFAKATVVPSKPSL